MPTLVLSPRQTEDAQRLWKACIAEKWQVTRAHGWKVPEVLAEEVVIYGEPLFAQHVAQTLSLELQEPPVDWLPRLPWGWRKREVRLTTLSGARAVSTRSFIKPADEKCFEARVYASGAELPPPGALPEDLPVLIQEVILWSREYRCFVAEGQVEAISAYWRDGHSAKTEDGLWAASNAELEEARHFCSSFLTDDSVAIPEAVAIDVGLIENRGWAVVECNAAWAAGIYGCNPAAVLRVLRQACRPSKEEGIKPGSRDSYSETP